MADYKYSEQTGKIIGCAMKVHNYLGPGFSEIIYSRCLLIELRKAGLFCETQSEKNIYYEGIHVGTRRIDILVEKLIILELKAVLEVEPVFYNQIINYLKVFELEVGLLLNSEIKVYNINDSLKRNDRVILICAIKQSFFNQRLLCLIH